MKNSWCLHLLLEYVEDQTRGDHSAYVFVFNLIMSNMNVFKNAVEIGFSKNICKLCKSVQEEEEEELNK